MNLSDLLPNQLVRGPTGSVYRVVRVPDVPHPLQTAVLQTDYPLEIRSGALPGATLTVDQVALDRFVPFTGDQPHDPA